MPVGTAIGISGLAGAAASIYAGSQQASAATTAADMQHQQYTQTRNDLMPYQQAGRTSDNMLMSQLPTLTSPITMSEADLQQTPGYQFSLGQGLKATQNSAAARGLGASGAAMRGAADYSTGLADSTYQQQFGNMLTSRQNSYNMLLGTSQLGENAAAQTGSVGTQTASNAGNALIGGAAASGASAVGAANALVSGVGAYNGYNMAQQFLGNSPGFYANNAANAGIPGGAWGG
jgi:hypothetical protein